MVKKLTLVTTSSGCVVPSSHKLNHDGYFRKCINGKNMMYHRYVYEDYFGPIMEGYEVDHKCKNRACCNINHLQLLKSSQHRSKDNKGRNGDRKKLAYEFWREHNCTGTALANKFGVSFSAGCKWIREWKQ